MEKTQWFEGHQRPLRGGVYECLTQSGDVRYSNWNGLYWGGLGATADQCMVIKDQRSEWQGLAWWGLTKS